MREQLDEIPNIRELTEIIKVYLTLRKAGAFKGTVLSELGRLYISYNTFDLWGSAVRISMEDLRDLVQQADHAYLLYLRKQPAISQLVPSTILLTG